MEDYEKALKAGKKLYQKQVSKGEYPYLPAMEDIISTKDVVGENNIGTINIPANLIVGTAYAGRTNCFAANFMPLMEKDSEFAKKWIALCRAHIEEGIREPIKVYEYMNRFYVVEGNKRVSVLKYFGAASIPAQVTRKIPEKTNEPESIIYYEFMEFYEIAHIYRIIFSKVGYYQALMDLLPGGSKKWTDDFRQDFLSVYYRFEAAYEKSKAKKLELTPSDVFLILLQRYGFDVFQDLSSDEMGVRIADSMEELMMEEVHDVELSMDPEEPSKKNLFDRMFTSTVSNLKVAFVNNKSVSQSGWVYGHELGRMHLENVFQNRVTTEKFELSTSSNDYESEQAVAEMTAGLEEIYNLGYKVIFTTTPVLLEAALRVSLEHPDAIILNCSVNVPHKYVRTYYGRMYEAKFIMGAIAAAIAENDAIGYVADYPIYGMTANINAFALGASMINPRAKVYLKWDTMKNPEEQEDIFAKHSISIISERDMLAPNSQRRQFGLCKLEDDRMINLAMPVWNWGTFYEMIVRSILQGDYKKNQDVALNYWWGMNARAIDIFCSHHLPTQTHRLAEFLKRSIMSDSIHPFCGKIVAQDGTVYSEEDSCMAPEELMKMEWLVNNIVGYIPTIEELKEEVKPIVRMQGVLGVHYENNGIGR